MIFRLCIFIIVFAAAAFAQVPPIEPGVSHDLAVWRAAHYSDVRYKLNLTLEKMSPVLKGHMEIRVKASAPKGEPPALAGGFPIVLDWRKIIGKEGLSTISNVSVNGVEAKNPPADAGGSAFDERDEHLIFRDGVLEGENVITLDFTSPILTSGSAITRYVDKEDGAEYIYSLFVPSDASTAFPVFDQPDLKARFTLYVSTPDDWKVIANTNSNQTDIYDYNSIPGGPPSKSLRIRGFAETKPISTYVFAFAAGPWERVAEPPASAGGFLKESGDPSLSNATVNANLKGAPLLTEAKNPPANAGGTAFYVRRSQLAKFKPHAAEVFRLTREGINYLETYFDYKFPFPKYDIVLIPEFPFGGMEHAGATFLRESSVIFPTEPTKNDQISRANLIFHETAHQWFGDTVTMKWFDDLWLKEGFAEFMAYKTLEHVMPEANAWKVFYERNKQAAYLTDSTKGTTPIYQKIDNLSAAKSAYGNIVYRKAPSFLRQAEFYLGEDKFQTAVRAFLKKHEFANAGWEDLVAEFEKTRNNSSATYNEVVDQTQRRVTGDLRAWAKQWVTVPGVPIIRTADLRGGNGCFAYSFAQNTIDGKNGGWTERFKPLVRFADGNHWDEAFTLAPGVTGADACDAFRNPNPILLFPNYGDYGYGIFLLDDKSRDYVLKNIGGEKDDFLRTMMWGSLWDSVREGELDPKDYVELVVKNLATEKDEGTIQTLLGRVSTAMNYYMSEPPASAGGFLGTAVKKNPPADAGGSDLRSRLEAVLIDKIQHAATPGQRITYYRAFLNIASSANARDILKQILAQGTQRPAAALQAGSLRSDGIPLRAKDRFDIVTRLIILGDPDAPKLLVELEKTETGDDAKRYAYAAHAAFGTAENKAKFLNDFLTNKDISESWIEAAMGPFNSVRHSDLTLPYLERALAELPNLKRSRKIFFVNGWLGAFIGGQRSEAALAIVNKFLADNPNLDNDLRLKILENVDLIERAVKIRSKYGKDSPQSH